MKIALTYLILIMSCNLLLAQVGIGTINPDNNTVLDIKSNSKGVLFPKLTDIQRNGIATPTEGLFIYNTDSHKFEYFNGTVWMALGATPIATENFYISEYCEGLSNNKYIEIYNPNNTPASLDGYELNLYRNGSNTSTTFLLSGTVAINDVFVIYHNSASTAITDEGDFGTSLNFNGNDVVELTKNGVSVDIVGIIGNDPGNGWDVAGTNEGTFNHVLQRKNSITTGNTDWALSAGTNTTDSEWIVLPPDDFSGLGSH